MGKTDTWEKPIFPFLPIRQSGGWNSMRGGRTKSSVDFVHRIQILIHYKITPPCRPRLLILRKLTPHKDKRGLKASLYILQYVSTSLPPPPTGAFFLPIHAISFYFYYF